jgi:hypothetical protein
VVREVRVQALHTVGRSSADGPGPLEAVVGVAASHVIGVGGLECRAEALIGGQTLVQLAHRPRGLEPSHRRDRAATRQPVERGERFAVDERVRLDDGRQSAAAADGDLDLTTRTATELSLDRRAIFRRELEVVQPSLFLTLRLMSA